MSEEKLKVGIILYQMLLSGGTERQAIMLARELVRRGYAVTLYTFQYNKEKCYQELLNGMRVVVENDARKLSLCIDRDTDILNPHEQIPLRVAAYFRRRVKRIPSVLMINDLYLAQWSLARELSPIRFSLLRRCMQWFKDQYESRRFFAGGSDEIAVLNNGTRDMLEFYLGRKSTVVRSGLDISRFPFSARAFPQRRRVRLLCHALFFRHRRFEDAIRAVARLIKDGFNIELAISGSYIHKKDARVYYEELRHLAEELGIAERVSFKGEVDESELLRLYKESDIFLFPSNKQTWGLAVFEAMASGLPVIVSRSAGASEVLTDYQNTLLSNPCSDLSIFVLVKELLQTPELYERLSQSGRAFVEKDISWERYTDHILALFQKASATKESYA